MRSHDTKTQLGKRHIEMVVNGKYSEMIVRTITKVKSGDNGFERYYATIDHKRVEVFLNPKGITGASFRSEPEYIINLGDEKVWWNEEKQDWETIDESVSRQSIVDLGNDCDGDLEAMENDLIAMNNEEKETEKIVIERSEKSEGKFSVSIFTGFTREIIRDFLPTQEIAIQCAQFASVKEGIDIVENQAAKDDEFEQANNSDIDPFVEISDENIQQKFLKRVPHFNFYIYIPICSACEREMSNDEIWYVGIDDTNIPFEFCQACKDHATITKSQMEQQLERISSV